MDADHSAVVVITPDDARFADVLALADTFEQRRYVVDEIARAHESFVVGAFDDDRCVGFLRFHTQTIGADVGRPPVLCNGAALTEGYVDAFGVDPGVRRRGVGTMLQAFAIDHCRAAACHQMRSRSPITSTENYALKVAAGYALHPSDENDSYFFVKVL